MILRYGPDDLARDLDVSRETVERLETHLALLKAWAGRINLVGPRELEDYWRRHALDCGQLARLEPQALRWIDLGSGAGFPGLVIAAMLGETAGVDVVLVEANAKKAAFLREAARAMDVPARVLNGRIEEVTGAEQCDVVTARALAPLKRLIEHAKPLLDRGAVGLFLKGAEASAELDAAAEVLGGAYRAEALESRSDPRGRVIRIAKLNGAKPD